MKKNSKVLKVMCVITLSIFIWTDTAMAVPGGSISILPQKETPDFLRIDIPKNLATIEEVYEAPATADPKMILYIQDLHGNFEAQSKIKNLLDYVHETYGFNLLFVEGATGELDPDYLRFFSDDDKHAQFIRELAKEGELGGAEMFVASKPEGLQAVGIERAELYKQNYEAFKEVHGSMEEIEGYLGEVNRSIEKLGSRFLAPDLRKMIGEWKKFESGHRDFLPYLKRLANESKRVLGLDLESLFAQVEWPQITRLLVLQSMEADLDKAQAEREKELLKKFLRKSNVSSAVINGIEELGNREITMTSLQTDKSQLQNLPRFLLERLIEEAGPKGFRFHDYPDFSLYASYLILQSEVDTKSLFKEIERIFQKILNELAVTDQEKNLLELYRDYDLLEKLMHLKLTRKEWAKVNYRKAFIEPKVINARIKNIDVGASRWDALNYEMTQSFVTALSFYDYARARDSAFYSTIKQTMANSEMQKAVLVTGGFHSEGLLDIFRDEQINYGVLMPTLTRDVSTGNYVDVMLQRDSALFGAATIPFVAAQIEKIRRADLGLESEILRAQKYIRVLARGGGFSITDFNQSRYAEDTGVALFYDEQVNGIYIEFEGEFLINDQEEYIYIPLNGEDSLTQHIKTTQELPVSVLNQAQTLKEARSKQVTPAKIQPSTSTPTRPSEAMTPTLSSETRANQKGPRGAISSRATKTKIERKYSLDEQRAWLKLPLSKVPFRKEINFNVNPYGEVISKLGGGSAESVTLSDVFQSGRESFHNAVINALDRGVSRALSKEASDFSDFLSGAQRIWNANMPLQQHAQAIQRLEESLETKGFFVDGPEATAVLLALQLPKNNSLTPRILRDLNKARKIVEELEPPFFSFSNVMGFMAITFGLSVLVGTLIEGVSNGWKFAYFLISIACFSIQIMMSGISLLMSSRERHTKTFRKNLVPYFYEHYRRFFSHQNLARSKQKELLETVIKELEQREAQKSLPESLKDQALSIFPDNYRLQYMKEVLDLYSNRSETRMSEFRRGIGYVTPRIENRDVLIHPLLDVGPMGSKVLESEEQDYILEVLEKIRLKAVGIGDQEMLSLLSDFDVAQSVRKDSFQSLETLGTASRLGVISFAEEFLEDALNSEIAKNEEVETLFLKTAIHELRHLVDFRNGRDSQNVNHLEINAIVMTAAYFDGYIHVDDIEAPSSFSAVYHFDLTSGEKSMAYTTSESYLFPENETTSYFGTRFSNSARGWNENQLNLRNSEKPISYYRQMADRLTVSESRTVPNWVFEEGNAWREEQFPTGSIWTPEWVEQEIKIWTEDKIPTVAFDLHGVLVDAYFKDQVNPEIEEQLKKITAAGVRLVLWTSSNKGGLEDHPIPDQFAKYFDYVYRIENYQEMTETEVRRIYAGQSNLEDLVERSEDGDRPNSAFKHFSALNYALLVDDFPFPQSLYGDELQENYNSERIIQVQGLDNSMRPEHPEDLKEESFLKIMEQTRELAETVMNRLDEVGYPVSVSESRTFEPEDVLVALDTTIRRIADIRKALARVSLDASQARSALSGPSERTNRLLDNVVRLINEAEDLLERDSTQAVKAKAKISSALNTLNTALRRGLAIETPPLPSAVTSQQTALTIRDFLQGTGYQDSYAWSQGIGVKASRSQINESMNNSFSALYFLFQANQKMIAVGSDPRDLAAPVSSEQKPFWGEDGPPEVAFEVVSPADSAVPASDSWELPDTDIGFRVAEPVVPVENITQLNQGENGTDLQKNDVVEVAPEQVFGISKRGKNTGDIAYYILTNGELQTLRPDGYPDGDPTIEIVVPGEDTVSAYRITITEQGKALVQNTSSTLAGPISMTPIIRVLLPPTSQSESRISISTQPLIDSPELNQLVGEFVKLQSARDSGGINELIDRVPDSLLEEFANYVLLQFESIRLRREGDDDILAFGSVYGKLQRKLGQEWFEQNKGRFPEYMRSETRVEDLFNLQTGRITPELLESLGVSPNVQSPTIPDFVSGRKPVIVNPQVAAEEYSGAKLGRSIQAMIDQAPRVSMQVMFALAGFVDPVASAEAMPELLAVAELIQKTSEMGDQGMLDQVFGEAGLGLTPNVAAKLILVVPYLPSTGELSQVLNAMRYAEKQKVHYVVPLTKEQMESKQVEMRTAEVAQKIEELGVTKRFSLNFVLASESRRIRERVILKRVNELAQPQNRNSAKMENTIVMFEGTLQELLGKRVLRATSVASNVSNPRNLGVRAIAGMSFGQVGSDPVLLKEKLKQAIMKFIEGRYEVDNGELDALVDSLLDSALMAQFIGTQA